MEKEILDFLKEINVSITISDTEGNIVYMNDKSKSVFGSMVGKNMLPCHKERSQEIIHRLLDKDETNVYTIKKGEVKKLIYQTPWHENGKIMGLVEFSMILPDEMPFYDRNLKNE